MKVMLVDDEDRELMGLENMLTRLGLPLAIVAQAFNGKEAVRLARQTRPDVIISDVRMPVMGGVEFVRQIRPELPDALIVMISGHEDFDAVREALNLRVDAWLVKPVNREELGRLLSARADRGEVSAPVALPARKEKRGEARGALITLLTGAEVNDSRSHQEAAGLYPGYYVAMAAAPADRGALLAPVSPEDLCADEYAAGPVQMPDGNIATVLTYSSAMDEALLMSKVEQAAETWKEVLSAAYASPFTVGVSLAERAVDALPAMYRQAVEALNDQVIYGRDRVIFFARFGDLEVLPSGVPLSKAVEAGDADWFRHLLDEEIEAAGRSRDIVSARSACIRLLHELALIGASNVKWSMFAGSFAEENIKQILGMETLPELIAFMRGRAEEWKKHLKAEKMDRNRQIVEKISEIIANNLGGDLSSEAIAEGVYLTPTHVRRIVKNVLGVTLQDYVLKKRMQAACALLIDPSLRVADVAALVGYESASYFSLVFRKFYGATPGEYKSRVQM